MSLRALVVIPAYNEASRLSRLFAEIEAYIRLDTAALAGLDISFLVVDDGSAMAEYEAAKALLNQYGLSAVVSVMRLARNEGKGAAIRAGFERGLQGDYRYLAFMDGDSSVPVSELHRLIVCLAQAPPGTLSGVIGSRVKMLGRDVRCYAARHYAGRVFATFVAVYYNEPVYDTQCGLKVFDRAVVRRYLNVPTDTRWVWDTELLLAMLHGGEAIHEIPIDWRETGGSKLSFWRDPAVMVWRLIAFRRRLRAMKNVSVEQA